VQSKALTGILISTLSGQTSRILDAVKKNLFLCSTSGVIAMTAIFSVVTLPAQTRIEMPPQMPAAPVAPVAPVAPIAPNYNAFPAAPVTNIGPSSNVRIVRTPEPEPLESHHYHAHESDGIETPSVAPTESPRLNPSSINSSLYQPSAPQAVAQDQSAVSFLNGERFPQTRTRMMTDQEAAAMSYAELRYAINEIYARHGADFPTQRAIADRFRQFDWYHPRTGVPMNEIENEFSAIECANVLVLANYKKRMSVSGEQ
jgi:hypothetical protein